MVFLISLALNVYLSFFLQDSMIYRSENKVTLRASENAIIGDKYLFEGELYLIVNDSLLRDLVKIKTDFSHVITTKVTDMSYLFYNSTLQDPKISTWDVSNVKSMSWMFGFAPNINPDISHWDTRSVVDFSDMFNSARKFRSDLSKWNTSSGELLNGMFFDSEYNGYLNDWDVSSAKNMSGMFDEDKVFNQPLDKWNVSNAEDLGGMFAEAMSFNQDISMWDVRKVKIMTNMFRNAISFRRDLSSWEVPLIKMEPENFSTNSPVISPKWNDGKGQAFNWYYVLPVVLIIPLLAWYAKRKGKAAEQFQMLEKDIYEGLREFLIQKNTNQITRAELDEILGITQKTLESQKRARSNFIKEFNSSGQGEIIRKRDDFDSRSFNYLVNWKKK